MEHYHANRVLSTLIKLWGAAFIFTPDLVTKIQADIY
jgi:hypothetical protein